MTLSTNDYLHLDSGIRDWVVIPMLILLVIVGIGRQYVQQLIRSEPQLTDKEIHNDFRQKQVVFYSQRTRTNGQFLSSKAYEKRKAYLLQKDKGLLCEKLSSTPKNPMMDNPNMMMDMMKGNMVAMVPNFAMMTFVSYFFSGFVCLKLPFPLPSNRFKLMMQRGIDLRSLDVTYVSSLSWYFIVSFGLNGVYRLILGENVDFQDTQMMQMQMGMMGGGGGGPQMFDANSAFKQEQDMLSLYKHEHIADKLERKLLGDRYPTPMGQEVDLSKFQ
jgi:ER membrane protein complex subunit 3